MWSASRYSILLSKNVSVWLEVISVPSAKSNISRTLPPWSWIYLKKGIRIASFSLRTFIVGRNKQVSLYKTETTSARQDLCSILGRMNKYLSGMRMNPHPWQLPKCQRICILLWVCHISVDQMLRSKGLLLTRLLFVIPINLIQH